MDITFLGGSTFRIKGKTGVAIADPKKTIIESLTAESKEIPGAGEYEVSGISVIGIPTEGGIAYVFEVDGLRILHLGNLEKKLPEGKVSQVGDIDILLVPVGNESVEMIQQVESYYVIPFGFGSEEELEKFLKESALTVEKSNKFSLKKDEIIEESATQIVVLEAKK